MKHVFTFLFLLAVAVDLSGQSQAQHTTLTYQGDDKPPVVSVEKASAISRSATTQAVDDCNLTIQYTLPKPAVCGGSGPIFKTVINWSVIGFIDSDDVAALDISDGSGNFTNAVALATANSMISLIIALNNTNLPVNLPYGTNYKFRLRFVNRNCVSNEIGPLIVPSPVAALTNDGPLTCAKTSVKLTATGGETGAIYTFSSGPQPSGPTSTTTLINASGPYSVTVTNSSSGCSSVATTTVGSTTVLPGVSITNLASAYCKDAGTVMLMGTPMGGMFTIDGTTATMLAPSSLSVGQHTVVYSYTNSSGCSNTASQTVAINELPIVSITGLPSALCQNVGPQSPIGNPSGGVFSVDGNTNPSSDPASYSLGQHTVVYSYTSANGCVNTASQMVTLKETPSAPSLLTQAGGSYPAGVSSLTISQNTGTVLLMVSGCSGGTINWSGGNGSTLAVSTANTGLQTFTATCTRTGCTSPIGTATVTVVAPTLKVFSRDPDNGQLYSNTLKPYLLLQNVGTIPIPYAQITVRYYLTTENTIPLIFQKNYVQIGQNNLNVRYVPLATPRQGATGYLEYSFAAGAGSLAPGSDSGPIEIQVYKQDYSAFNQLDDYSYINNSAFTLNPRITAYENGVIFYGMEPVAPMASPRQGVVEANTLLQVRVLGNPIAGQSAQVEISGVAGQAVQLELTDLQGRPVHQQRIGQAGAIERVTLPLGTTQGLLLLQVSTPGQRQQIKLLKH